MHVSKRETGDLQSPWPREYVNVYEPRNGHSAGWASFLNSEYCWASPGMSEHRFSSVSGPSQYAVRNRFSVRVGVQLYSVPRRPPTNASPPTYYRNASLSEIDSRVRHRRRFIKQLCSAANFRPNCSIHTYKRARNRAPEETESSCKINNTALAQRSKKPLNNLLSNFFFSLSRSARPRVLQWQKSMPGERRPRKKGPPLSWPRERCSPTVVGFLISALAYNSTREHCRSGRRRASRGHSGDAAHRADRLPHRGQHSRPALCAPAGRCRIAARRTLLRPARVPRSGVTDRWRGHLHSLYCRTFGCFSTMNRHR